MTQLRLDTKHVRDEVQSGNLEYAFSKRRGYLWTDRHDDGHYVWLALFRICFSIVGIAYLSSYWNNLDLLRASHPATQPYVAIMCAYAIATAFARLIGWGGKMISVMHFAAVTAFLTSTFPCASVNEELYLLLSFWCCFLDSDRFFAIETSKSNSGIVRRWPLFLLGINLGVYVFSSGLFKIADPVWTTGETCVTLLRASHMCPAVFSGLANVPVLPQLTTYAIIAFDLTWLLFFIVPATRLYALFGMFLFFFGLIVPVRLDFIGEMGCCAPIALAALCPEACKRIARFLRITPRARFAGELNESFWADGNSGFTGSTRDLIAIQPLTVSRVIEVLEKFVATFLAIAMLFSSLLAVAQSPWNPGLESIKRKIETALSRPWSTSMRQLNGHSFCLGPKDMFTAHQRSQVGQTFKYRFEVVTTGGARLLPLDSFREDGSAGADMLAPLQLKVPHLLILPVSMVCSRLENGERVEPGKLRQLDYVMEWIAKRSNCDVLQVNLVAAKNPPLSEPLGNLVWKTYCIWTPNGGVVPTDAFLWHDKQALQRSKRSAMANREEH